MWKCKSAITSIFTLQLSRNQRFSASFHHTAETLVNLIMPHITQKYKDNLDAARNANHSLAVFIKVRTCFCCCFPIVSCLFKDLFVCFVSSIAMFQPDGQRVRVQTNQQLHELFHAWWPKGRPAVAQAVLNQNPSWCLTVFCSGIWIFLSRQCLSSSLSSCVLSATMSTMSLWTCPCRLEKGESWDFKVGRSLQTWWGAVRVTLLIMQRKPNGFPVKDYKYLLRYMLVIVITYQATNPFFLECAFFLL